MIPEYFLFLQNKENHRSQMHSREVDHSSQEDILIKGQLLGFQRRWQKLNCKVQPNVYEPAVRRRLKNLLFRCSCWYQLRCWQGTNLKKSSWLRIYTTEFIFRKSRRTKNLKFLCEKNEIPLLHRGCFIGKKYHFYSGYTQSIQWYQENDASGDILKPCNLSSSMMRIDE